MKPDDVAQRFNNRPGHRLTAYGAVGIPVYRVTAVGLTLVKKELGPIEEFVLRALSIGLSRPRDVCGFLGLSERVLTGVIGSLISRELVVAGVDEAGEKLALTPYGRDTAVAQSEVRPSEQTIPFTYDAILRRPKYFGDSALLTPREARSAGLKELRGLPNRGPELHELVTAEVGDVLALALGDSRNSVTLLRLTGIERRMVMFCEAVALCYRPEGGGQPQVAFAIDGRLSEEHELAFAAARGLERNEMFRLLGEGAPTSVLENLVAPEVKAQAESVEAIGRREAAARALANVVTARTRLDESAEAADGVAASAALRHSEDALRIAKEEQMQGGVRHVEVYEHSDLLQDALENARERLLVISPWIRSAVVDERFLEKMQRLLARGVKVCIGYGLGRDAAATEDDRSACDKLHKLAEAGPNLRVVRLGDTHAKVLIKDREFSVITSFNWLSFRGDRRRPFREELGYLIALPAHVDDLYDRLLPRFDAGDASLGQ